MDSDMIWDIMKFPKDGSWNYMISAHRTGQIFATNENCPYCFRGKEWAQCIYLVGGISF